MGVNVGSKLGYVLLYWIRFSAVLLATRVRERDIPMRVGLILGLGGYIYTYSDNEIGRCLFRRLLVFFYHLPIRNASIIDLLLTTGCRPQERSRR